MPSRYRLVLLAVTFVSLSTLAATNPPKKFKIPKGFRLEQSVVIPPSSTCPSGDELKEPTPLTANSSHVLSTTFDVVQESRQVPVYTQNPDKTWTCTMTSFNLRMYKDPVTGVAKFPGPTLMLQRATDTQPGDSFSVLLQNHLPLSNETCVWAKGNCGPCTGTKTPQCCKDTTTPNGMNCMHGDNTTNLHFHGTHVSPQSPQDYVLLQLQPYGSDGKPMHEESTQDIKVGEFQYAVNPLPKNQAEGTHWYHPHKHGSTALQVGNGMAGAVIIHGPFDDWLQKQYNGHLREKLLVVQNVHDLNFTSTAAVTPIPLINGQLAPQITMYKGEIQRWRFVNANIDADSQLEIDFNGVEDDSVQARQIAMDGVQFSPRNYYCQPLLDSTPCDGSPSDLKFEFSPGNRADFLIKAPTSVGKFYVPYEVFGAIENQGTAPKRDPRGGAKTALQTVVSRTRAALDAIAPGIAQPALLSINVIDCPAGMDCAMKFPDALPDLPPFLSPIVPNRPVQNVQFQVLNSAGAPQPNPAPAGVFGIWVKGENNDQQQQFDDTCAAFTEPLDPNGGEEWHVSQNGNRAGKPFHVFHIHTNPFQVVSTYDFNGKKVTYPEPIWQDSITLPNNTKPLDPNNPSTMVVLRQRFEDYTGPYVLHCHFLGHEDRGMMLSVQTVCPNNQDKWSVTSATQQECTFNEFHDALPKCQPKANAKAKAHK